jgi:uncharacterized protein YecT (DUF1311 family)
MRTVVALATLLITGCALAQNAKDEPNWEQVCAAAKTKPLPAQTPAGPLRGRALETCDETALYYGFDGKPDYTAALQCGWWQQAHPQPTVGNMFYGPGVLTMLYANGQGVTRDPELAIQFACRNTWAAPAEMAGRIGHLEALRDARSAPARPFDLCDDITSGLSMGSCTSVGTRAADAKRSVQVNALVAALPAAAKSAFPALQAAETAFETIRVRNEIDLSGTARAMFMLDDEKKLRDQFLINLQRFGKRDVPTASAADVAALDARLNTTYQQLQHLSAAQWESHGAMPFDASRKGDGIRETERAWVKLADAWIAFARVAYPGLPETQVRAQLIRLRLHQLESLKP